MDEIRVHLIIQGRVQGVWFRDSTRREARRLGLSGWVRNMRDGNVEVLAEGPAAQIRKLVAWCGHGPPSASVTQVRETPQPWRGEFTDFDIIF